MKPSVKCREAGVNGGEGKLMVRGSFHLAGPFHKESWLRKYGERESRMNRWEEKMAVESS